MTERPQDNRLVYLLPRYDAGSPEHIFHTYGFLRKLSKRMNLEVLVEQVTGDLPGELSARALCVRFPPLRFCEEFLRFLAARLKGVRIFYVHYSYTGAIAASLITRLLGGTTYYWNCGMYEMFKPSPGAGLRETLRYFWNRLLLETSVRWCNHLVTGTPRMAAYYAEHAGIRKDTIQVLPNFVDLDRFRGISRREARARLRLDPDRKIVLFLHRVAPRKGAHFLPDILRALARETGPLTLVVAGDGPYLPELQRRMREEGLESMVDYRHWVPNRDAPLYFRAVDLYIMPSVEEGFPRVLLESMAAGCPFVAFAVGGVRDILSADQAECAVNPEDVTAFSALCVQTLGNPALLAAWRAAGEKQVARFAEERVLDAFIRMTAGQPVAENFFIGEKLP